MLMSIGNHSPIRKRLHTETVYRLTKIHTIRATKIVAQSLYLFGVFMFYLCVAFFFSSCLTTTKIRFVCGDEREHIFFNLSARWKYKSFHLKTDQQQLNVVYLSKWLSVTHFQNKQTIDWNIYFAVAWLQRNSHFYEILWFRNKGDALRAYVNEKQTLNFYFQCDCLM